jgi:hypothetical protein
MLTRKSAVIGALLVALIAPSTAEARGAPAMQVHRVSGGDPLPPAGDPRACGSPAPYQGWEQETALAVDPANHNNVATAWIQDWADAIVVGYSADAGRTWGTAVPPTTFCTHGLPLYGSAFDEALSFGPAYPPVPGAASTLYMSSNIAGNYMSAVVNVSPDSGRSWGPPVILDTTMPPMYIDGTDILADPGRAGRVWALWRKGNVDGSLRKQYVARSDDGGASWSAAVAIPSQALQGNGQLLIMPDGSLVDIYGEIPLGVTPAHIVGPTVAKSTRSMDLGATWSTPVTIATADTARMVGVSAAAGIDGSVYVAWQTTSSTATSMAVMVSRSRDGGRTWQRRPSTVAAEPGRPECDGLGSPLSDPAIAVGADGTVGVAFYDHRHNVSTTNPPTITDYWLRTSIDGGEDWDEQHVAGPFDQTVAPSNDGSLHGDSGHYGFLGDYWQMQAIDGGFGLSFVLTNAGAPGNPTDTYFATVSGGGH